MSCARPERISTIDRHAHFSLGTRLCVPQTQPGNFVYDANKGAGAAHLEVHPGGGETVRGSWNGNQTVLDSVSFPPAYTRVR